MASTFRVGIRLIFLVAYASFLWASLRHIAYFFASFEPAGSDWTGAYALAISIDVTALVLTIGVMFFRRGMPRHALVGVWFFISCLTAFSWLVNWEYAMQFQGNGLDKASSLQWLNPILASAFAFLNLAYSVVAELFNSKPESAAELRQKNDEFEALLQEKARQGSLKNAALSSWISGKRQVVEQAFSRAQAPQVSSESSAKVEGEAGEKFEEPPAESEESSEMPAPEPAPTFETESAENGEGLHLVGAASQASSSRKYLMTYEEAAEYTGYGIPYLKAQVTAGKIGLGQSGKLKVSDLRVRSGQTGKIPAIRKEQSA